MNTSKMYLDKLENYGNLNELKFCLKSQKESEERQRAREREEWTKIDLINKINEL